MTGAGTNTYLLGEEQVAVLDPGPAIPEHVDAILAAAGDRIRWIICTHTHPDHSPAWQAIHAATGAEVIGAPPADDMFQDDTFRPDRKLAHDDVLATDEFTLRAVHTPGHVSNHYCFFLEEERMLFAGDHIMNGSTVVIVPPSGDMKAYIESLQLLLRYDLKLIAPGHGEVMEDSRAIVEWLVNHRLKREHKVIDGLRHTGRTSIENLVKVVYDDVDVGLHEMASLSLSAHLIKLQRENRALQHPADQSWELLEI
ncbi:MBL fold metallo-hydrolase [Seongchinamella sediminis]|uniref:MBL fold metallo-hydrolase n=2 Tax=Seongchinamella sediminis TaxID=2283635 RepID=A0A3L7E573_9GAMM|nr:MBL fold metallo-hydrolase [Seongchinamella sediminis]RLQ23883.1 MBL fold metallo-hydrolase [Seongchinamella sediminis]